MRRNRFKFKSKRSHHSLYRSGVPVRNLFMGFALVLRIAVILGVPFVIFAFQESITGYLKVLVLWYINERIIKAID
ncbi:hypothetical protein [Bacillus gaemokensis]|uniref:Uncharacterized protein n=1 Tax=Bacillus gaemokensis TaxID=574375 RepID=A0A073K9A4_9BACI|nr:hypothetical protein [Bacillus gaemokensis]KEK23869.1 hypothetical protein BAGA_05345 [Bacillus gaemokensis]KYG38109.1 hypothetical protein AZF08_20380 [Bacillus gaemokensis]